MVNLYFDEWPRDQFLEVDLTYDDVQGPAIQFRIREAPLGDVAEKMKSHFRQLELLDLYQEAAASAIVEYRITLDRHSFGTAGAVREHLIAEADGLRDLYGNNHWKALTVEALANSETFLRAVGLPLA